jgi:hypothetical protein
MDKVLVQITGGLGNQLFQFAAGLSMVEGDPNLLAIEQKLGKPRSASKSTADIFGFTWPNPISIIQVNQGKVSEFMSRVTGYCLRMGVKPSKLESKRCVKGTVLLLASLLISTFLRKKRNVVIGQGVGYSKINNNHSNSYLIGYFQSYKYAEKNRQYLLKAKIQNVGPELEELNLAAIEEIPLVVHLRFGDYLLEENFGIPSREFYSTGIRRLLDRGGCKSIWVFSDDLPKAREKLDLKYTLPIRWINSVDDSVVSTLQAMRLGQAYVIANSTFSWWAAYLALNLSAEVVAPSPWFMGMEDPKELIPPNWEQIDAGFEGKH